MRRNHPGPACNFSAFMIQYQNALNKEVFHKKRLTDPASYVIVIGRMEELRSFFYAQNCLRQRKRLIHNNENLSGGGSRAHKDHTGMY